MCSFTSHTVQYGKLDIIQYLAANGASADLRRPSTNGTTPMGSAAGTGQLDVMRWLYSEGGAAEDIYGDKSSKASLTPMEHASKNGYLKMIKQLKRWGVPTIGKKTSDRLKGASMDLGEAPGPENPMGQMLHAFQSHQPPAVPRAHVTEEEKEAALAYEQVRRCHRCLEGGRLNCSRCKTCYCSAACQKKDWPAHKSACRHFKKHGCFPPGYSQQQTEAARAKPSGAGVATEVRAGFRFLSLLLRNLLQFAVLWNEV